MIDTSHLPRNLTQTYGNATGAMYSDYFEGILIKSDGTAMTIDAATRISY